MAESPSRASTDECRSYSGRVCWILWLTGGAGGVGLFLFLFLQVPNASLETQYLTGSTMGTFYTVTYRGELASSELQSAFEVYLSQIESQLSNWDKDSWVSRFNVRQGTEPVAVPEHAHRVLQHVLSLCELTDGALDPTLGGLINLWGFGPVKTRQLPGPTAIEAALQATGIDKLTLLTAPPRIAKTHPALHLNLSAVAKGYAADILARYLESKGIANYVVNIGGDMRSSGYAERNVSWTVGIQKPDSEARNGDVQVTLELGTTGMATSGDYRRYVEVDGKRFPHVLDPNTGKPAESDLASVTIMAPTGIQADGLATACLVLGLEKGRKLIESFSGVEGLFIQRTETNQYRSFTTSGWPDSVDEVNG